jgi:hypothetical protein
MPQLRRLSAVRSPRWRALAAGSLVALAAIFAACGETATGDQQAERVAVQWLRAMASSDVETACRLMDADNHPRYPEHPHWGPAKSCREMLLHGDNTPLSWKPRPNVVSILGESHPEVLEVVVDGNRATVVVDGLGDEGRPIWLQEERGRWLVDRAEYPI